MPGEGLSTSAYLSYAFIYSDGMLISVILQPYMPYYSPDTDHHAALGDNRTLSIVWTDARR